MERRSPKDLPTATGIRGHLRSNIVGYVALFLALSSSAYAAGLAPDSVRSRHIRDNQVKSADVRDDSLTGGGLTGADIRPNAVASSEVADDSLGGDDLGVNAVASSEVADNSLGAADLGADSVGASEIATNVVGRPEIAVNTIGSEELLAIDEVGNTVSVPALGNATVTATCPAGKQIISGGFAAGSVPNGDWRIHNSQRSAGGWTITGTNPDDGNAHSLTAYAYCLTN